MKYFKQIRKVFTSAEEQRSELRLAQQREEKVLKQVGFGWNHILVFSKSMIQHLFVLLQPPNQVNELTYS